MLSQFAKTAKGSSLEGDEDDEAFAALAVVDDEEVWEDVEDTEKAAVTLSKKGKAGCSQLEVRKFDV